MLRKRTSFKPNVAQVAVPKPDPPIPQQVPQSETSGGSTTGMRENASGDQVDSDVTKRINDAISQLTGQKFEPIKLNLRNSGNRNVKLKDLIFTNPPLTKDQRRHRKSIHLAKSIRKDDDSSVVAKADMEEPSLVPQVKLGPDGKLVLDDSSTVINRDNVIKTQEAIIEDNDDIVSPTNYKSYLRKPMSTSQTKWSNEDTLKFYQALSIFGTDFSVMESLYFKGHRSRTDLKRKFKREERLNKGKIELALANRITINSEELDELKDMLYTS